MNALLIAIALWLSANFALSTTAELPRIEFVPAQKTVTVNRQNVDAVDFDGAGLTAANTPVIRFISPSSTYAGNSSLNITVTGANRTWTSSY